MLKSDILRALNTAQNLLNEGLEPQTIIKVIETSFSLKIGYKRSKFYYADHIPYSSEMVIIEQLVNEWYQAEAVNPDVFEKILKSRYPHLGFWYAPLSKNFILKNHIHGKF